ncbi:putative DNA primase/helicase [Polaromonas sp. CG_9.5]|nr:putative DNA primase/helicase [Polaromonas sp. CG_9.5]
MNDLMNQFKLAIAATGLAPPTEIIGDGAIHRFSTSGKPIHKNGWYMLHTDGIAAGVFGDWREGLTHHWCSKADTSMTEAERFAHRERIKTMQRQRADDLALRQQFAAAEALKRWTTAQPCAHHDYLARKGIQPHGAKMEGDKLLIAMRDTEGEMHSLQTIAPDGSKMFMSGGRVKGCYFGIGKPKGVLIVCEGFATGASIHECTGHAVAVAFNAGNLDAVAVALRTKYPTQKIVIAADDDHQTPGNPGMRKATAAAQSAGAALAVPVFKAATT